MRRFTDGIRRFFASGWSIALISGLLAVLLYVLYTSQPILVKLIIPAFQMPYGSVIAWLTLILFPLLAYLFLKQTTPMLSELFQILVGRLVRIALFLGCWWGTIGYFLAENWHFTFTSSVSNQAARSQAFWLITGVIPILTLVALLSTAIGISIHVYKQQKR